MADLHFAPNFTPTGFARHRNRIIEALDHVGLLDQCYCRCDNPICDNRSAKTIALQRVLETVHETQDFQRHRDVALLSEEAFARDMGVHDALLAFGRTGRWLRGAACTCGSPTCPNKSLENATLSYLAGRLSTRLHALAGCSDYSPVSNRLAERDAATALRRQERNAQLLMAFGLRFAALPDHVEAVQRIVPAMTRLLRSPWFRECNGILAHGVDTLWEGHPDAKDLSNSWPVQFALMFSTNPTVMSAVPPASRLDYSYGASMAVHALLGLDAVYPAVTDGIYAPWAPLVPLELLVGDAEWLLAEGVPSEEASRLLVERPAESAPAGERPKWARVVA